MQTPDGMVRAFERLVDRVLDGRVIPFVGAGISRDSRVPGDRQFAPDVAWMRESLQEAYKKLEEEVGAVPVKRDAEDRLDHLADLVTWLAGASRLCKMLRIEAFAQLPPLPAHRFLAYFAREGLITEIITTNYDTCIEQAFRASFGATPDAGPDGRAKRALAVVFNLAHYRTYAGKNRTGHGDPVLHLYKINGDAADYQAALDEYERHPDPDKLERRAARIIVTERQLQTFRDELWAKDLYADRTRSRSLLFCGFGSDEPQVRHHAMALMEEMQRQSQPVGTWEEIPELPNAPFFAQYGNELQFNQLQVLAGFAMAHTRPGAPPNGSPVLKVAFANALLGELGGILKEGEKKLPADLFLAKLFQAVWLRRAHAELEPGGVFPAWLSSIVKEHRAWAGWMADRLGTTRFGNIEPTPTGDTPEKTTKWRSDVRTALFGLTEELFAEPEKSRPGLLMQWLHAVGTGGKPFPDASDFYLSLREAPLFILCTLLLILWIAEGKLENAVITAVRGIGLKVTLPSTSPDMAARCVYLVRESVRETPLHWEAPVPNLIWLIEIPGNDRFDPSNAVPVIHGKQPGPLQAVKMVRRSAAAVLRTARSPNADPFAILTQVFSSDVSEELP